MIKKPCSIVRLFFITTNHQVKYHVYACTIIIKIAIQQRGFSDGKGGSDVSLIFVKKLLLKTTFYKFIPGIIWFLITFWLFTLPGSSLPKISLFDTLQIDKLVHAFLFFVLCILFMFPIKTIASFSQKNRWTYFCFISILFIGYGIAIEFIQRDFIENRSFDIWDIAADTIGCLLALLFGRKALLVYKKIGLDGNRDRNQN